MKMDSKEFMGRVLSVAISAPPTIPDKHPPSRTVSNSLGGGTGTRKPLVKTEQKSRISFIPASVQKAAASAVDGNAASPGQPVMSNDDFRKMLLK